MAKNTATVSAMQNSHFAELRQTWKWKNPRGWTINKYSSTACLSLAQSSRKLHHTGNQNLGHVYLFSTLGNCWMFASHRILIVPCRGRHSTAARGAPLFRLPLAAKSSGREDGASSGFFGAALLRRPSLCWNRRCEMWLWMEGARWFNIGWNNTMSLYNIVIVNSEPLR